MFYNKNISYIEIGCIKWIKMDGKYNLDIETTQFNAF